MPAKQAAAPSMAKAHRDATSPPAAVAPPINTTRRHRAARPWDRAACFVIGPVCGPLGPGTAVWSGLAADPVLGVGLGRRPEPEPVHQPLVVVPVHPGGGDHFSISNLFRVCPAVRHRLYRAGRYTNKSLTAYLTLGERYS